jgi:hypothetical protein
MLQRFSFRFRVALKNASPRGYSHLGQTSAYLRQQTKALQSIDRDRHQLARSLRAYIGRRRKVISRGTIGVSLPTYTAVDITLPFLTLVRTVPSVDTVVVVKACKLPKLTLCGEFQPGSGSVSLLVGRFF